MTQPEPLRLAIDLESIAFMKSKLMRSAMELRRLHQSGQEAWRYADELEQERKRLNQVCRNVYEVWAGSEGIPQPQTASEAYLLRLVEQMRDEAKKGLK